jgi:uncharacterized protein (DUF1810 family)
MENNQLQKVNSHRTDFNVFEAFGGNIGHNVRELIPHRINSANKNLIICLEGWIDMEQRDGKRVLSQTLLISVENSNKLYKCLSSYPELVLSEYEARGKAIYVMEFEALPEDIREFKVIRICSVRRFGQGEFIWRDVLCYVQRNASDVYTVKTAEARYVNTTLYEADIKKVNSFAYYVNRYWKGSNELPADPFMRFNFENWRNNPNWRFSLERFIYAQERYFELALDEIRVFERKMSHWMWFVFPQVEYLGKSDLSKFYSLSYELTIQYLNNEYLMRNMKMILSVLMQIEAKSAAMIFGRFDSKKFMSSLSLFHFVSIHVNNGDEIFEPVLEKYFGNQYCSFTQNYLEMAISFEVLDNYLE